MFINVYHIFKSFVSRANLSYRKVIICMQTGEDIYSWESLLTNSWGSYASKKVESSSLSNSF